MNITTDTIKKLQYDYNFEFYNEHYQIVKPNDATHLSIICQTHNHKPLTIGQFIGKSIKTPRKKEITYQWVIEKLNPSQNISYANFCKLFSNFINNQNLRAYATTYGIAIESIFKKESDIVQEQNIIEHKLKSLGIIYKTEYSDAHWIYRYKISKSKENIEKIKQVSPSFS